MAEGSQPPFSPEDSTSNSTPLPSAQESSTLHPSQVDQQNMEFAPLPSHHFGHLGLAHSPFDMRHMSHALPDYAPRYHQSHHTHQATQATMIDPQLAYSPFPGHQYAHNAPSQLASQYSQALTSQYKGISGYSTNTAINATDLHVSRGLLYPQQQPFYTTNMPQQNQYPNFPGQQPQSQYGHPGVSPYQTRPNAAYQIPRLQVDNSSAAYGSSNLPPGAQVVRRESSSSSLPTSSALRGPPRKPKQSGFALWVGNLPPGTQIIDLKDHFSRDATEDIESVFLISKSNCAFVNYKTEETCAAAMARFHDSRFRGVRLVCRLRRGSSPAASPATATVQPDAGRSIVSAGTTEGASQMAATPTLSLETPSSATPRSTPGQLVKEKYFIVKSLTVEDLERSVTSGIWATQAHNEENLNAAFETAENVYLIFSANKSGEYFGYARMESSISADTVSAQELDKQAYPIQNTQATSAISIPMTIATPATNTAPRGHIVDDSARGTIFWEAEGIESTPGSALEAPTEDSGDVSGDESTTQSSLAQTATFGKPFYISWQSTERLPFYRTRGLRNPWNANREVKIARDGTELEPTVGRKLVGMFEQQAQINAAARAGIPSSQYGGYPQQMSQYMGPGMVAHMPYGYGAPNPGQSYGRPY